MSDTKNTTRGTDPPDGRQHRHPRRVSPENSVTLRHHRLARDASMRAGENVKASASTAQSPRRNSSGDSYITGNSDARKWFDQSNEHPSATFDSNAMDVDPPFFQKETDSSNEEETKNTQPYRFDATAMPQTHLQPPMTHSSSADDYRSVIDDLTVEIQRLKEELKRYKRNDLDSLKKEKLFEIKVHGLPQRKKRELEATLRDFAASLDGTTSIGASSARKKSSARHPSQLYAASGTNSKHSSSGSNSRPVDSAYASASTGPNSSGASGRPSINSARQRTSDQKVESYLREIPEGLYPRHMVMTDKDRKKLVVRRLEHLFTGKLSGKRRGGIPPMGGLLAPVTTDNSGAPSTMHQPASLMLEPAREARIAPDANKKGRSRDNASTSNSNGDQTESGGNSGTVTGTGTGTGTGANTSPPTAPPPEQRPTRPRDLDPDRVQNPSENMEYIRHLGLVPPELVQKPPEPNMSPDAEGWVYLNLLCNLAQLHMFNVTPDYIRAAVSEKSTKFQLSADGRKIRWRGGLEGTKFSSDSSGDNSQKSPSTDENTDGNQEAYKGDAHRRKHKADTRLDDATSAGPSSSKKTKSSENAADSSHSFHYQPLFAKRTVSQDSSRDDTESSLGAEGSNVGGSGWGFSRSGSSPRKKRRLHGGITYYNGAPFCTDLSGDTGDGSPTTYMASSHEQQLFASAGALAREKSMGADSILSLRPLPTRTTSGSWLKIRPLSDENFGVSDEMDIDDEVSSRDGLVTDDSDLEADISWSEEEQRIQMHHLEASGLGGVVPEDHFVVVVTTRRLKHDEASTVMPHTSRFRFNTTAESIVGRLAAMSTASPQPSPQQRRLSTSSVSSRGAPPTAVGIVYVAGRLKRLNPTPLPPPATFFRQSSDGSSDDDMDACISEQEADLLLSSEEFMSRRANPHLSDNPYPENEEITSADEAGDEPEEDDHALAETFADMSGMKRVQGVAHGEKDDEESSGVESEASDIEGKLGRRKKAPTTASVLSKSVVGEKGASSLATRGGAGSGYSSSEESGR